MRPVTCALSALVLFCLLPTRTFGRKHRTPEERKRVERMKAYWRQHVAMEPGQLLRSCADSMDVVLRGAGGRVEPFEDPSGKGVVVPLPEASAGAKPRLHVFWTIGPGAVVDDIVREMATAMEASGLARAADAVFVAAQDYPGGDWAALLRDHAVLRDKAQAVPLSANASACYARVAPAFEFPALEGLYEHCHAAGNTHAHALYMHTKGSTADPAGNAERAEFKARWRNVMLHFTVKRWRNCVDALSRGFATCGALLELPPWAPWLHYTGNFWFARCSHVRDLVQPRPPRERDGKVVTEGSPFLEVPTGRFLAEWWIHGAPADGRDRYYKNMWGSPLQFTIGGHRATSLECRGVTPQPDD